MVLLAVVVMQTVFFCVLLRHSAPGISAAVTGPGGLRFNSLTPDFVRYETPAYNLANGRSLSLPLSETKDHVVFDWVCSRHPHACLADGTHPTALYPPGYSIFVAGIYKIFGRSIAAVIAIQYLLLIGLFVLFETLAARLLDVTGYLFVMAASMTYPFLAMYAGLFSTEHLHVVLYLLALASMMLMEPGWLRGAIFGLAFGLATLVRPYSLLVFPAIWVCPTIWAAARAAWSERLVNATAFAVPLLLWCARNAYWFGRFLPMTTLGPGLVLMHATLSWNTTAYERDAGSTYYADLATLVQQGDVSTYEADQRLTQLALQRIKQNPGRFMRTVATNIPKLWVSLGTSQTGISRAWPLLVAYLGSLWILGVSGGWLRRHDARWHLLLLSVGIYWAFLLYSTGEARRTIALRLPMLLLAGSAVSALVRIYRARRNVRINSGILAKEH